METSRECVETWRNVEFQSEQSSGGVSPTPPHPRGSEDPHCAGKPGSPGPPCKPMDASVQTGCEQLHIPC